MLVERRRKNENVVYVDETLAPCEPMENAIDEALKRARRVHAAERHHIEFVELAIYDERELGLVLLLHANLPKCAIDVERGEKSGAAERVDSAVDERQ